MRWPPPGRDVSVSWKLLLGALRPRSALVVCDYEPVQPGVYQKGAKELLSGEEVGISRSRRCDDGDRVADGHGTESAGVERRLLVCRERVAESAVRSIVLERVIASAPDVGVHVVPKDSEARVVHDDRGGDFYVFEAVGGEG